MRPSFPETDQGYFGSCLCAASQPRTAARVVNDRPAGRDPAAAPQPEIHVGKPSAPAAPAPAHLQLVGARALMLPERRLLAACSQTARCLFSDCPLLLLEIQTTPTPTWRSKHCLPLPPSTRRTVRRSLGVCRRSLSDGPPPRLPNIISRRPSDPWPADRPDIRRKRLRGEAVQGSGSGPSFAAAGGLQLPDCCGAAVHCSGLCACGTDTFTPQIHTHPNIRHALAHTVDFVLEPI